MSRPLFEITQDLVKIDEMLDEIEGDLSKLEHSPIHDWFDALGAEEGEKLDAYVALIKRNEMEAVAAKAEKEQWSQKEKARTAKAEWLKARLKNHLEITKRAKVQTAKGHTIAIQKNGGKVPVSYDDTAFNAMTKEELESLEGEGLLVFQPVLNKDACHRHLTNGGELPFAKLSEVGTHLRIK